MGEVWGGGETSGENDDTFSIDHATMTMACVLALYKAQFDRLPTCCCPKAW